jgi:hypothetical protein
MAEREPDDDEAAKVWLASISEGLVTDSGPAADECRGSDPAALGSLVDEMKLVTKAFASAPNEEDEAEMLESTTATEDAASKIEVSEVALRFRERDRAERPS